ncbi:hypothetical protein J437_LFUL006184, partial [Ladona fulva]
MDNQSVVQNEGEYVGLDAFCGSPFWDLNVTWNTNNPDITRCFQKTVLVWFPCAFLWIFSPLEFYYISLSKNRHVPWTWLNVSKLLTKALIIVVTIVDLAHTIDLDLSGENIFPADYCAPIIRLFSFGFSILLLQLNLKNGLRTSGLLFLFWLLLVVCETVQFRSLLINTLYRESSSLPISFILFMVYYPLAVIQLFLNCFADAAPKISYHPPVQNPSPEIGASYLSKMIYSWYDSLLWKGFRRSIETKDLWNINFEDSAVSVVPRFDKYWLQSVQLSKVGLESRERKAGKNFNENDPEKGRRRKKKEASILPAICKAFGSTFVFGASLKMIQDILTFIRPQILSALIVFVSSGDNPWKGYFFAILMFVTSIFQTIFLAQYFHRMYLVGMRIRTAVISAIYRKALRLSNAARRESTVGEIVNLMSVDAQRFMDLTVNLNLIWSAPLQIILALYFLWHILGPAVLSGLAVMVLLIPCNVLIAHLIKNLQISQMKHKDQRVKLMNEILNGIKVLKLYAWEPSFEEQIIKVRNKELKVLKHNTYLNSGTAFVWSCAPFLVSIASFATFVLMDEKNVLDSQTAFVSIALFNILRFPLAMLPFMITSLVQAIVSIKRLNKFMNAEEIDPDNVQHDENEVENGTFGWGGTDDVLLKDINFHVKKGQLVAVVGSVGSGKSSLISALLGEMEKICGRVNTKGTIAYVPQQAWIQNALLKDNILFGKKFDNSSYRNVIKSCALKSDLEMLPAGDQTEIGEKGINLSGGQKQRISLARAVYGDAEIYLMDDPLSAVDSHVGKHIFENVIGHQGILQKKTRILVTHGITFLSQMDEILVMKEGRIIESGTYKELLQKKGAFAEFIIHHIQEDHQEELIEEEDIEEIKKDLKNKIGDGVFQEISSRVSRHSESHSDSVSITEGQVGIVHRKRSGDSVISVSSTHSQLTSKEDIAGEKLIEVEKAETGKVKWQVYIYYIRSIGVILSVATLIFSVIYQCFAVGSNFWLANWSSDESSVEAHRRNLYLGIYGALGLGQAITCFFCDLTPRLGCWNAGRNLQCLLLKGVLRAPMTFFDTTPLGRILARFSKDLDVMDSTLPPVVSDIIYCAYEEAPWEIKSTLVPKDWPADGRVEFNNYQVRYREGLDLVLKGIDFKVQGGEKIGIVGRTGAGKSSLTLSLFRIIEAAGGCIIIDGIDISKMGLHALRGHSFKLVIVLDKGKIVEFDSPSVLMSNKNSLFCKMAKDA